MKILISLFFLAAVALCGAQFSMLQTRAILASMPEVQKELKLTKEQRKAIQEAQQAMYHGMQGGGMPNMDGGMPNMDMGGMDMDKPIVSALSDDQNKRLTELWYQYYGPALLNRKEVGDLLTLTDAQKKSIADLVSKDNDEKMDFMRKMGRNRHAQDDLAKLNKAEDEAILALLTPDQAQKWKSMLGEPFKFKNSRMF